MKYDEYIEIVKKIARNSINNKKIDNLRLKEDLGIDSLLIINLIIELENEMKTEIKFEDLQQINVDTPADLWLVIERNQKWSKGEWHEN